VVTGVPLHFGAVRVLAKLPVRRRGAGRLARRSETGGSVRLLESGGGGFADPAIEKH
jgi:hypothetical protein